ncbi:Uncharacterised protein [Enterococcus mundtii]|nr:Uncharacterised protein [Enterococcus mundtii]
MTKVSFHTTITASETQIQLEEEQIQLSICSKSVKEIENSFYLYYLDKSVWQLVQRSAQNPLTKSSLSIYHGILKQIILCI